MYFRPLDSIPDHARVPPKFSLIFQRLEENSSPARRPWPTSGLFCSRLIRRLRSIPPVVPARI